MTWAEFLPLIFMAVMGLALLAYVVLDGYDLGVGLLLPLGDEVQKDTMVSSIGPFWDANETWLVLGVGVLLVAFPKAHGLVLQALYLPAAIMIVGLILRGVAFDFRVKAPTKYLPFWNRAFFAGSLAASASQGWMLGSYITGFDTGVLGLLFSLGIAITLPAAYLLLGAGWLIMKTDGELQQKAVRWARRALWPMGVALLAISVATPLVSPAVFEKWFGLPQIFALMPRAPDLRGGLLRRAMGGHAAEPHRRGLRLARVRQHGAHLRAGLLRPGLQHLPGHRDRATHAVGRGSRHQLAHHHLHRCGDHAADDHRVHDLPVPRVLGQGAPAELRLIRTAHGPMGAHPIGCS